MTSSPSTLADPRVLPPADARLLAAIRDPQLAATASELVQHAVLALFDLQRLDESLFARYEAGRRTGTNAAALDVQGVSATIFRGLRAFVALCRQRRPASSTSSSSAEFDLDDLEAVATAVKQTDFNLDAGDIGDVLSSLDEHLHLSEAERMATVLEKLSSIEYGLTSLLDDLDARLPKTSSANAGQALELLDDLQGSASEGVYAALMAVYEAFLPDADPSTLAPGYLTTLQRALLVRRGLAGLAREVNAQNEVLQAADPTNALHVTALETLRLVMARFVASEPCKAMRPADRFQVSRFEVQLREQPVGPGRLTAEGLARYLESLGSINRREVLVVHDQRKATELREAVAEARQLSLIRARLALEPARKAVTAALALFGKSPATDALITSLRNAGPALHREEVLELALRVCERLSKLLTA